nr:carboxypeptidase-like regulatory domain-containing protein [Oscillochloris trichoides]
MERKNACERENMHSVANGLRWISILFLLGALVACSSSQQPPLVPSSQATSEHSTYPYPYPNPSPETHRDPAYPFPELDPTSVGRSPEPVPTPNATTGVVHGYLYNQMTNEPLYDGVMIYLSRLIPTDNQEMDAVSFDKSTDPFIDPDIEGGFAFSDVPPGRYGIVVQAPLNQYLTRYANDQTKDVIITVEAGQSVDVGRILAGFP